ncbi:hypothetical protein [Lunatimonas salinarum]|uniref:hypothetical protein n=1 Tax=Lunatimonas salinarum TaxID=1774590 RepID=UPI001ADF253F|nr:hypothetical protein [Lunatimonas salinarum]
MKKINLLLLACLGFVGTSCQDTVDPVIHDEEGYAELESEWIRLTAWETNGSIRMINPVKNEVSSPSVSPFTEGAANYLSSSGRYVISIERQQGNVRFFDTGIENHGDHGHEYSPKWLDAVVQAPLPTHFSATNGQVIIFNDGDGSVVVARESTMETPTFQPLHISDLGNGVHHGAATWLIGNKYAVTYKDEAVPGALPQSIKLVNAQGEVVAENEEAVVTGIHGDASNGRFAAFGSTDGILVASQNNEIKLIPNPSTLSPTSGNWIGTIKTHDAIDVFYGYARNHGVFEVNPSTNSVRKIVDAPSLKSYFLSSGGGYLIVHTAEDEVKVFDTATSSEMRSQSIAAAGDIEGTVLRKEMPTLELYRLMNEPSPVLAASEGFLYILKPDRTTIQILDIQTLNEVSKLELDSPIHTMMRAGF